MPHETSSLLNPRKVGVCGVVFSFLTATVLLSCMVVIPSVSWADPPQDTALSAYMAWADPPQVPAASSHVSWVDPIPDHALPPSVQLTNPLFAQSVQSVLSMAQSGSATNAAAALGEQAVKYWMKSLGEDFPDWAKRISLTLDLDNYNKPTITLLTVQPLYQSQGNTDTLFVQASYLHYELYGDYRDTTNLGIGYRRLLDDNKVLLGVNGFYDQEWTYDNARAGCGIEGKWNMLDFYANGYVPVTGWQTVNSTANERTMAGWDAELRSQIPYLPWATIGVKRYVWIAAEPGGGMQGWTISTTMRLTQNFSLELGGNTGAAANASGTGYGSFFAMLNFHFGDLGQPVAASNQLISDQMFSKDRENLSSHTLDEVRRENRVITERRRGITVLVKRSG